VLTAIEGEAYVGANVIVQRGIRQREERSARLAGAVTKHAQRSPLPSFHDRYGNRGMERCLRAALSKGPVTGAVPSVVYNALRAPGEPLVHTAAPLAARLGVDARDVRVRADSNAARSAAAVQARVFSVGKGIVFGAGQYAPHTSEGPLIAHDIAHVAQQHDRADGIAAVPHADNGPLHVSHPDDAAEREAAAAAARAVEGAHVQLTAGSARLIQRTCGSALGTPAPACDPGASSPTGERFLFEVNCDDLRPGEATRVSGLALALTPGSTLTVHGFASDEGPPAFNIELSCHRANKIAGLLAVARPDVAVVSPNLMYGATPGPAAQTRSVIVQTALASRPACGPDATDWFVDQVATAKTDPAVLDIQADLTSARGHAAAVGLTSERIVEGAVLEKVLAEERRAGSPSRTPTATAQITSAGPGASEFSSAKARAVIETGMLAVSPLTAPTPHAALALWSLKDAALKWKALVRTGARYDFKNDPRTMQNPRSANCPKDCRGTITFCPISSADCFLTDVPGNLFYAHIGGWVGFSELVLQLGSQFAQLDSTATWDPPEDTAMIALGFALPDPLTRMGLCGAVNCSRSIFTLRSCDTCPELTTAAIV
jgi:outer membrane protein OmpA-like peptidoglycan-associated protein